MSPARTAPIALALSFALAPALAQDVGQTAVGLPDNATELRNKLDGDANIAGTDEAIGKSDIPMEGAVSDTMGEALALDQATDCAGEGVDPSDCTRVDPTETGAVDTDGEVILVVPDVD